MTNWVGYTPVYNFLKEREIIMNKIYKVIWSKAKNCYVVVSELAKRNGKCKAAKTDSLNTRRRLMDLLSIHTPALTKAVAAMLLAGMIAMPNVAGAATITAKDGTADVNPTSAPGTDSLAAGYNAQAAANATAYGSGATAYRNRTQEQAQTAAYNDLQRTIKKDSALANQLAVQNATTYAELRYELNKLATSSEVADDVKKVASNYYNALDTRYKLRLSSTNAVAVGYNAKATEGNATAVGGGAQANGINSVAVGATANVNADAEGSVVIGYGVKALTKNVTLIGMSAGTARADMGGGKYYAGGTAEDGTGGVAIGYNAKLFTYGYDRNESHFVNIKNSIALGSMSHSHAAYTVSIGTSTDATGERGFAIGTTSTNNNSVHEGARAAGQGSIAFGDQARTVSSTLDTGGDEEARSRDYKTNDAIAIGTQATARTRNAVAVGGNLSFTYYERDTSGKITGLNTIYANDDVGAVVGDDAFSGIAIGGAYGDITTKEDKNGNITSASINLKYNAAATYGQRGIAIGTGSLVGDTGDKQALDDLVAGRTAIGGKYYPDVKAAYEAALGAYTDALSNAPSEDADPSVIEEYEKIVSAKKEALNDAAAAFAPFIRQKLEYEAKDAIETQDAIAIGTNARAGIENSIAIGSHSQTKDVVMDAQNNITYAGDDAGTVDNIIGYDMGTGKKYGGTDRYSPTWMSTAGSLAVGGGTIKNDADEDVLVTRRIAYVAAGWNDTDAVNVAQLKRAIDATVMTTDNRSVGIGAGKERGLQIISPYLEIEGIKDVAESIAFINKYESPDAYEKALYNTLNGHDDASGTPTPESLQGQYKTFDTEQKKLKTLQSTLQARINVLKNKTTLTNDELKELDEKLEQKVLVDRELVVVGEEIESLDKEIKKYTGDSSTGDPGLIAKAGETYTKHKNNTGTSAKAAGKNALAVGYKAVANGNYTIAFGKEAKAYGKESIAYGKGSVVGKVDDTGKAREDKGDQSIALGVDNTVTGNKSIAMGPGNKVTGNQSIAIGTELKVYGEKSGAIGDPMIVAADNSYVVGNRNNIGDTAYTDGPINENNIFIFGNDNTVPKGDYEHIYILGSNVTIDKVEANNSVFLGNNSGYTPSGNTTAGKDGYGTKDAPVKINGKPYQFAGASPAGVVSVGNNTDNGTRRIQNVAAGLISESSTDAINGSQLYAAMQALSVQVIGDTDENTKSTAVIKTQPDTPTGTGTGGAGAGGGAATPGTGTGGAGAGGGADTPGTGTGAGAPTTVIPLTPTIYEVKASTTTIYNTDSRSDSGNLTIVEETNPPDDPKSYHYRIDLAKDINVDSVTAGDTVINKDGVKATKFTAGNTTINNDGLTIAGGSSPVNLTNAGLKVGGTTVNDAGVTIQNGPSMTKDGIDAGGKKITNVAKGEADTDAVNVGQMKDYAASSSQAINDLGDQISRADSRSRKGIAGAAALAALHPMDFDPDDKLTFAAGVGNFRGETAAAIGAFYRPDEKVMFSIGGTFGNSENLVNAGISFSLDRKSRVTGSRTAMAKEIVELREQVAQLTALVHQIAGNQGQSLPMPPAMFPNTPENKWAYDYIESLQKQGVLSGYAGRELTRNEMAAALDRALASGVTLDERIAKEFAPELSRIRVVYVNGQVDGEPRTFERPRSSVHEYK